MSYNTHYVTITHFILVINMKKQVNLPIPAVRALCKLEKDVSNARRCRITSQLMAERADVSRTTIGKIENGDKHE